MGEKGGGAFKFIGIKISGFCHLLEVSDENQWISSHIILSGRKISQENSTKPGTSSLEGIHDLALSQRLAVLYIGPYIH